MSLKLNSSGGGSVTLQEPVTASTLTLNLPSTSGTMVLDGGSPAFAALAVNGNNISAVNSMGFRNRIINGDMRIDQRNAGVSVSIAFPSTNYFAVDRFQTRMDTSTGSTTQQSSVTPAGFTNSNLVTVGTGATPASGAFNYWGQRVEGFNMSDFGWGTASAQSVTLSFWVRSSLTGTFGISLRNASTDRSYVSSYVISTANTWEQKTITIAGDTGGTWNTTNGVGAFVFWDIGQGSSNSTSTTNTWQAANFSGLTGGVKLCQTSGATFYITGVQLEAGTVATPFERIDYGRELMLCQRYCRIDNMQGMTFGNLAPAGTDQFYLSRTVLNMRVAPTCTFPDGLPTNLQRGGISLVGSVVSNYSTENCINLLFATGTAQTIATYYANQASGVFRIVSSSEL